MNKLRSLVQRSSTCLSRKQIYERRTPHRCMSYTPASSKKQPRTAILMAYTGGPKCKEDIDCFVKRVLKDKMLSYGSTIKIKNVERILDKVHDKYTSIGNTSPQFSWMKHQAEKLEEKLDTMCVNTAPHKTFIGCQFVRPSIYDALRAIHSIESIENIVVLPMYPQYSCGLTGGCFNMIYSFYKKNALPDHLKWAVVDNWAVTYSVIQAEAYLLKKALLNAGNYPYYLIYAARPMPSLVYEVGDFYPFLVGSSALYITRLVGKQHPYTIAWHKGANLCKWMEPTVEDTIKELVCLGKKCFVLVPISTVIENLITLYDYDVYVRQQLLPQLCESGMKPTFLRIYAPNATDIFVGSVARVVKDTLTMEKDVPPYMKKVCTLCQNPLCVKYKNWFGKLLTRRRIIAAAERRKT